MLRGNYDSDLFFVKTDKRIRNLFECVDIRFHKLCKEIKKEQQKPISEEQYYKELKAIEYSQRIRKLYYYIKYRRRMLNGKIKY